MISNSHTIAALLDLDMMLHVTYSCTLNNGHILIGTSITTGAQFHTYYNYIFIQRL